MNVCVKLLAAFVLICTTIEVSAADMAGIDRKQDVIYGRKFGMALTMDVIKPKLANNGLGVIFAVSAGWVSAHEIDEMILGFTPLLTRGYTVFAVVHGSQPKFTIPEVLEDMNRAVRFIRFHAKDYGIDPDNIGIMGGSAGGHLSLMQGCAGDKGDPKAKDPIDRCSSRVQAVACFYPPTDFLNYGKPGQTAIGNGILKDFAAPFDFHVLDPKQNKFVPVKDKAKIEEIARKISPAYHVNAESAPTLICHGDADELVPIQQAHLIMEKYKAANVDCKLIVKPGAGHGWEDILGDLIACTDWFDAHLKKKAK